MQAVKVAWVANAVLPIVLADAGALEDEPGGNDTEPHLAAVDGWPHLDPRILVAMQAKLVGVLDVVPASNGVPPPHCYCQ